MVVNSDRYPMCKDQPAQIDCRETDCFYHVGCKCVNTSPAITIGNGMFHCWSKVEKRVEVKTNNDETICISVSNEIINTVGKQRLTEIFKKVYHDAVSVAVKEECERKRPAADAPLQ